MTPKKLTAALVSFPYGGNGGAAKTHPATSQWIRKCLIEGMHDSRISEIVECLPTKYCDTPITMTRNAAIYDALNNGIDVLIMVDSDMWPDCEPDGKSFFATSFDFLYHHYEKGPCVIGAPYCGPPPNECVYVFRWTDLESRHPNCRGRLEMYSRDHASQLTGITNCGALPTGVTMFDTRVFRLTEPKRCNDADVIKQLKAGEITDDEALKLLRQHSWCYYQYTDSFERHKSSTEDVTLTRDLSMAGLRILGYNPLYCNWDAWAGHSKEKIVRKPEHWDVKDISAQMRKTIVNGLSHTVKKTESNDARLGPRADYFAAHPQETNGAAK